MKLLPYTEYELDLEPEETLFVYTDGVPEATDADLQLFGTERMLDALNREPDAAPEALIENLKAAIGRFTGAAPAADDTTMLCVRRRSGGLNGKTAKGEGHS